MSISATEWAAFAVMLGILAITFCAIFAFIYLNVRNEKKQ